MNVVGRLILTTYCGKHADLRSQVDAWLAEADEASWRTPNDIKKRYSSASFLANNRVVFNLKGNAYRLDTKIAYQQQIVLIKRIGTHPEYSKWKFD